MAMTPKQARFVEEYLVDLNATQAAIRAGYSAKTAGSQGQRLLMNVEIQATISAAQSAMSTRTGITQDRVMAELARIGFSDIRKAVRWGSVPDGLDADGNAQWPVELVSSLEIDDDTAAAIVEVSLTAQGVKIKFADKLSALEKIGKHLGMFNGDTTPDAGHITVVIKRD